MKHISISQVKQLIKDNFPNRALAQVIDHGIWVRHIFELVFEDGSKAFMKANVNQDWLDSTVNEARLCALLQSYGLPAPETIFIDGDGKLLGRPFLIQTKLAGVHWSKWLSLVDQEEWPEIFEAVGETYAKIHSIKGESSGVWDGGPEKTLPISPNDFYYKSEVMSGSGKKAFDSGIITRIEYLKIQSIWEEYYHC